MNPKIRQIYFGSRYDGQNHAFKYLWTVIFQRGPEMESIKLYASEKNAKRSVKGWLKKFGYTDDQIDLAITKGG